MVAPQRSQFDQLPSEIITLCLLLVLLPENYERGTTDVRELCCVSRSFWRAIRAEPRFWNHLTTRDVYSIPLQIMHIGPQTPLFIYWLSDFVRDTLPGFFPPVLSLAHRWVSLIIESSNYSAKFYALDLYAIAPALKYIRICKKPVASPSLPNYSLSSDNLESLELRGSNILNWSPTSFFHLKNLILSIDRTWNWIGDMLEVCPTLESFELSGDLESEARLDESTPIRYIYLSSLRKFSVNFSQPSFPSLIRRIVALNLEKLNIRFQMMDNTDVQFHAWASTNPTLKTILSQDDNGWEARALSLHYTSNSYTKVNTYTIEDWRDRFTLQVKSTVAGWGIKLAQTLDEMDFELNVSAPLAFAIKFVPYPLKITSLTIKQHGDPRNFLRLVANPAEGVVPYPVLRELYLTPSILWAYDLMYKKRIEDEVELLLRTLWERRGSPANPHILLDVFNSEGVSFYRDWQT
jgi:hypothetical protein